MINKADVSCETGWSRWQFGAATSPRFSGKRGFLDCRVGNLAAMASDCIKSTDDVPRDNASAVAMSSPGQGSNQMDLGDY